MSDPNPLIVKVTRDFLDLLQKEQFTKEDVLFLEKFLQAALVATQKLKARIP